MFRAYEGDLEKVRRVYATLPRRSHSLEVKYSEVSQKWDQMLATADANNERWVDQVSHISIVLYFSMEKVIVDVHGISNWHSCMYINYEEETVFKEVKLFVDWKRWILCCLVWSPWSKLLLTLKLLWSPRIPWPLTPQVFINSGRNYRLLEDYKLFIYCISKNIFVITELN